MTSAGMGDTIMDAPAIHSLKQRFPKAQLSVLVHYNRGGDEICRLMPSVDETIDLGLRNYRWPTVIRFMLGGFWKLLFNLRRRKFDLAVVFFPNPVRRLLLVGLGSKHWVYGNLMDDYPGEQNRRLVQLVGIDRVESENVFEVPDPTDSQAILPDDLPRPLIGVHPFCGLPWKEWKRFDQLQQRLQEFGGTIVTVGRKEGYDLPAPTSNVVNLINKVSIAELFWVIDKFDVFVTADSGPMHIGFAVGTLTVALFGFLKPQLLAPAWAWQKHKIIYKPSTELEDIDYVREHRKLDDSSMRAISADEVIEATKELLARYQR
jgi:ADP-heptose:LPS heptosyltransferase